MTESFLKWPGGKRWLVRQHVSLFPFSYRRYIEPFLGGGSIFFHLAPQRAVLSDTNCELISAYRCLRDSPKAVEKRLIGLHKEHSEETYYRLRRSNPVDKVGRAVRFIYLNRTCFNGMYRVNLKGEFNVPIGTKTSVAFPDGFLHAISSSLQRASIKVADFEESIDKSMSGDFVFVDPPYTMMHNKNNFVKYNANLFSWSDQLRLAEAIRRAARRGAAVMLSNADHHSIRELYANFGYQYRVSRSSVLAANASHRRKTSELLVLSYDPTVHR